MVVRRDSSVFGKAPMGATHFALSRKGPLAWEWCSCRSGDQWLHELPIADLALPTLRRRFGHGTYRVTFLALSRGNRQVLGSGRVFDLTASGDRPASRDDAPAPEDHSDLVRALLRAAEGKRTPQELFEALAIPTGMGLSSVLASLERLSERLETVERRLDGLERSDKGRPDSTPAARLADPAMDRVLEKLESIERRLPGPQPARRASPAGKRRGESPPPR